jgi:hypothetical protein
MKKRPQSQRDSPKIWLKRRHDLNSSVAQINDGPTLFRLGGNQTGCLRAMLLLDVDVVSSHGAGENTLAGPNSERGTRWDATTVLRRM